MNANPVIIKPWLGVDNFISLIFMCVMHRNLRNYVELQPLTTFDEVCSLACKLERQHKGSAFGMFKQGKGEMEMSSAAKEAVSAKITTQEVVEAMKGTLPLGASKEPAVKKMVCFKCQGLGHVARNCPNRTIGVAALPPLPRNSSHIPQSCWILLPVR